MSITISQQPTTPNMANNNLLFTVSSNSSSAAQYQFIADLSYSGSATVLQKIKQQPNPSGYGVFDLGQVVSNYLDIDNVWKTAGFATASEASKRFSVKFGEEYASSISGAAIQYNGEGAEGAPSKSGSVYYYFTNGLVDPYNKVNWNFPSASYFTMTSASATTTFDYQHVLTNAPYTQSIQEGEYATISLYNGNFNNDSGFAQDIYSVLFTWYDATGSVLQTDSLTNVTTNGGGPRTNQIQVWSDNGVYNGQTAGTQLVYIGVGPQNLDDLGFTFPSGWAYYRVQVFGQTDESITNPDGVYADVRFDKQGARCGYDGVRFAWKNEFGVWDYFTFTLADGENTNIERQGYTQTFVDYSTPTNSVSYNKERRGIKQFFNKLTNTRTANSDWLTQEQADWLKELFYSTEVYQQDGTDFFPIAITSTTLTEKKNIRTQRVFNYSIEFVPANQPNARL